MRAEDIEGLSMVQIAEKFALLQVPNSTVAAGGNVLMQATGAGQASTLTVQGSQISAGQVAQLRAEGDIHLQAAQNTHSQSSSNSSSGQSIGVSVGLGQASPISIHVAANKAQGQGTGSGSSYSNSQITAGQAVTIEGGGDLHLTGAVISAPKITGQIAGNLIMQSLQDSDDYQSRQTTSGASLSFSPSGVPIGGGAGGSVSAGQSRINSSYQSVGEQTAIRAGDGGWQLDIGGSAQLTGAAISSSAFLC